MGDPCARNGPTDFGAPEGIRTSDLCPERATVRGGLYNRARTIDQEMASSGWIPAGWVAVTYAVRQHRPSLPYASVLAPPIRRIPGRPVSLRLAIGREMFHPVPRNFLAAADPDIFLRGHVIQEMAEGLRPCRVPGQSAMQAN